MIHSIINRGVKDYHDAEERRQINLLNIASFTSFSVTFSFLIINTIQHIWIPAISNSLLIIFTVSIFFINQLKYYTISIYTLLVLLTIFFVTNAILLHNSMQYGVFLLMVFAILLLNNKAGRIIMLAFQIASFVVFLFLQNRPSLIGPVPLYKTIISSLAFLFIFACMLEYFKARLLHYHQSLTLANEQLKESNRVKERMLSILSHDFNAPVGNLITSLDLLDEQFLTPEEFHNASGKLKVQLQILTSSMKDVLQWSKMQIRGDAGERININIDKMIEEIVLLFESAIREKKLLLQNKLTSNASVYANQDHVKLIFRNLLSNAIKFSHTGGSIFIGAEPAPGTTRIYIKDEGTGMPTVILNALKSEQLTFTSTNGTAKEKGTGLGLMLVREFIHKNNGELSINSEQGKGSTFFISLPSKS